MEIKRSIKFTVEQGIKRPNQINISGKLYAMYSPERTFVRSCEYTAVKMQIKNDKPQRIFGTTAILLSLQKQGLHLESNQMAKGSHQEIELELINKNLITTIRLQKKQDIATHTIIKWRNRGIWYWIH